MKTEDFSFDLPKHHSSSIKVIGVGGGGSNAVNYMFQQGIEGVDFVVCNTDAQALNSSPVPNRIQLGQAITEGLGAGANPEVGEQAALESIDEIKGLLDANSKMVFITAGMGGGTGTGAAPIIAGVAKDMGILTVGIVTAPFSFEGKMRLEQAEQGIRKLQENVDSLIVINNNKLRELYGNLGYKASFAKADEVLTTGAKGIAEVISKHYSTNIDLKDARTVLADSGTAIMGTGKASGENKAKEAVKAALDSPLLNNNKISGATNVLLLIVSGSDEVTMDEIGIINEHIQTEAGHNANIIMGVGEDLSLEDKIAVTIVATGFPSDGQAYTGKEDEKIVHTLEEEQPLTQILSTETPFPVRLKKMPEKAEEPEQKAEETTEQIKFELEDQLEEEPFKEEPFKEEPIAAEEENDWEPVLKTDNEIQFTDEIRFEEEVEEPFEAVEEQPAEEVNEFPQTIMFTLDGDIEDEITEIPAEPVSKQTEAPAAEVQTKTEVKAAVEEKPKAVPEVEKDPFDEPLSQTLSHAIEERRARLKQFNYKFKNSVSNKTVDEIESVPAYKRQGVDLSEREDNSPSDFIISENSQKETKIRPNNFLHDNVD
ncbi:MAG: cell division protein FtsZ [Flavobacteriia bacterium]|nr:cell division protein FtsZ [Flavobacteriia bacterium]